MVGSADGRESYLLPRGLIVPLSRPSPKHIRPRTRSNGEYLVLAEVADGGQHVERPESPQRRPNPANLGRSPNPLPTAAYAVYGLTAKRGSPSMRSVRFITAPIEPPAHLLRQVALRGKKIAHPGDRDDACGEVNRCQRQNGVAVAA